MKIFDIFGFFLPKNAQNITKLMIIAEKVHFFAKKFAFLKKKL